MHITALERFILGDPLPTEDVPDDLPHVKNDIGRVQRAVDRVAPRVVGCRRAGRVPRPPPPRASSSCARSTTTGFAADSWTPMGPGTVAELLGFRIFDSWVHEQDMRRAVDRPGDLDSPAARGAPG